MAFPTSRFVDPNYYKDKFGVEGRIVLLTFGLLSPNKGIEYVLNALPSILAEFPERGLHRPRRHASRMKFASRAKPTGSAWSASPRKNKIQKNVIFYNRLSISKNSRSSLAPQISTSLLI